MRLFGSPDRELPKMRASIVADTEIYLLNIETLRILGPFVAASEPGRNIVPGAFGGKFNAQIRVAPVEPIVEAQLERRPATGAKSAEELRALKLVLAAHGAEAPSEPQPKRQKLTQPQGSKIQQSQIGRQTLIRPRVPAASGQACRPSPRQVPEVGSPQRAMEGEGEYDMFLAPGSSICWDFVAGSCPRGESCRYTHLRGSAPCYLFLCNNATWRDCAAYKVLGSPAKELPQMKHFITQETQLFLLNYDSLRIIGAFSMCDPPAAHLVREAFGGKYSAQVRVTPLDEPLLQATLGERMSAGPMSLEALASLRMKLQEAASEEAQAAWDAPAPAVAGEAGD